VLLPGPEGKTEISKFGGAEIFRERLIAAYRSFPPVGPDSKTLQSTHESGSRAGYDGAKRWKGSKVHWRSIRSGICALDMNIGPISYGFQESAKNQSVVLSRPYADLTNSGPR
jgi:hypothetical protein